MAATLGTVDHNGFVWTSARQTFIKLYVATGDAKAAARDAKLPEEDSVSELLEHPSIKEAVEHLHEQVLRRIYETADTVIARYSNIAEGSIFDYIEAGELDHKGRINPANVFPKDWRLMPRHMQQRVKKFKVTTPAGENAPTNFEIELHDQVKANDMLMRILRLDAEERSDDARTIAESIHAFFTEIKSLDDHYDDPDKPEDG